MGANTTRRKCPHRRRQHERRLHSFLLRGRFSLLDLDYALGFSSRPGGAIMIVSGDPDVVGVPPLTRSEAEAEIELRGLIKAVGLFIENYRQMHARTAYAPQVDAAALQIVEKLLEL